jgi:hypothetical protein
MEGVTFNDEELCLVKLFNILYADDTVILSESANDLQIAINLHKSNCDIWTLTVNTSKTKVLVFSKGRQTQYSFTYSNENLEVVEEFSIGSFPKAKTYIANQAIKAMYCISKT